MAGHSKWANIQHRKGRQDEKRGKVWTRIIREIMVAARQGGGDISANPRLRLAVDKALRLIGDGALRYRLGRGGVERVTAHFTVEQMAARYEAIYQ